MKKKSLLHGIKPQVLKTPAYTLKVHEAAIKLNQNENPFDFPEDLKEEVFRRYRARAWSRYPDFVPDSLHGTLARAVGWKEEGILVGNGSNELLQATLMVTVGDRTPVAIPTPTFTVYGLIATILGGRILQIPLNEDMSYNVDRMIELSEEAGVRILILCTPNNPTGTVLSNADLENILQRFSGFVLLDEAYHEFCGTTGIGLLERYPRLIITRTFSKAMGMAGLRLGYLLCHPEIAREIAKAKLPYNVNQFSLLSAQVALENMQRFEDIIGMILRERDRLGDSLRQIPGVKVYPTGANFHLFEVPCAPREVFQSLLNEGVLVRDVSSYPYLSRCLRVSVGTREENDRFLVGLRRCLAEDRRSRPEGQGEIP